MELDILHSENVIREQRCNRTRHVESVRVVGNRKE